MTIVSPVFLASLASTEPLRPRERGIEARGTRQLDQGAPSRVTA